MATRKYGDKTALMVVDVQVGVMQTTWDAARVIQNIRKLVEKARYHNIPVIWVQHADEEIEQGTPAWELVPELVPLMDEQRIHKHYNAAFENTSLAETLASMRISHIVLAGAATNWCIRATAYAALDRGFDVTLVSDAHTTETLEFEDGSTIEAADIIKELNIAMTWLSYPDRDNTATPTAEIDFT